MGRKARGCRSGAILVLCLVLVLSLPIPTTTAIAQGQTQSHGQQNQRHTLVIIHGSGTPSWSITVAGSIQLAANATEETDSIGGNMASGSVGGLPWEPNVSDPRDVIYYTGELLQFDLGGTGQARVTLDGKRVTPQSLTNTPTPPQSPPSTPTSTTTSTPTTTPTTLPTASPTPTGTETAGRTTPASSPSDGGGDSGSSLTVSLVLALAAVIVLIALWRIE